jgi:hypothetical protein
VGALLAPLAMVALSNSAAAAFSSLAAVCALASLVSLLVPSPHAPAASGKGGSGSAAAAGSGGWMVLPLTGAFIGLSVGAEISFGAFAVPYALGMNEVRRWHTPCFKVNRAVSSVVQGMLCCTKMSIQSD